MGAAQILHSFFFHAWICAARRSALRAAASEGLTLVRASDNATGFRGVKHGERRSKPFKAERRRERKKDLLGYFTTAEEAALAYARELGVDGSKAAAAQLEHKQFAVKGVLPIQIRQILCRF